MGSRGRNLRRGLSCLAVTLAVACAASLAAADDDESPKAGPSDNPFYALDTKNLFGFLEGADVGEAGDKSLEFETTGASGRAAGQFQSVEQEFIFEPTLTNSLGLEFGAHVLGQDVKGVPDLPDFTGVDFMGFSVEARYVVKHRTAASPIQVTLTVEPQWDAIGDAGQRVVDFNARLPRRRRLAERRPARLRRRKPDLHARRLASARAGVGENLNVRRIGGHLIPRDAAVDVRRRGRLRPGL